MIDWPWKQFEKIVDLNRELDQRQLDSRIENLSESFRRDLNSVKELISDCDASSTQALRSDIKKSQRVIMSNREEIARIKNTIDLHEDRLSELEFWQTPDNSFSIAEWFLRAKDLVVNNAAGILGAILIFISSLAVWWVIVTNL